MPKFLAALGSIMEVKLFHGYLPGSVISFHVLCIVPAVVVILLLRDLMNGI
jgi:predicted anti-sigma-YlaC factor YlaD